MKYCFNCGQPLDDDAVFCTQCGTKVAEPSISEPEPVAAQDPEPIIAPGPAYTEPEPVYSEPEPEMVYAAPEPAYSEPAPAPVYAEPQSDPAPAFVNPAPAYYDRAQEQQNVYSVPQASYTQPVSAQKSPGKTIAGFVLGIVSLSLGAIGVIFAFVALNRYAAIAAMIYAIIFGMFAVGCGIAGMILSAQAGKTDPGNQKARLGRTFSLIGLIAGGCAIVFGIIFGIIGITKFANLFY